MKKLKILAALSSLLLITACTPTIPNFLETTPSNNQNKALSFKTSQVHFMHSLKENTPLEERNNFIDEFILKSDVQCQNYLNNPLKKPEIDNSKDSLYMNLFDSVSSLFGIALVTNTAKAVFLENDGESQKDKEAYANALSPEIRKGVELGRSRYANTMVQKKALDLKAYPINSLKIDTLKYDKQCNDVYGLIEINRALKEMQNTVHTRTAPSTPILNINPNLIKDKVIAVSKEVEAKKIEIKTIEKEIQEEQAPLTSSPVVPTQPKLQSVPVHHDSVPNLPRSIQPLNE